MKRIMIKGLVVTVIVASAALGLRAQDSTGHRVLTLEEAIKIALKNGVLLNTQRNVLQGSQFQKMASIASIAPNVSVQATASRANGNNFIQQTEQLINGTNDNINASINANLNLFSGFSRINSIRQYSNALDAQVFYVNRTAQDVMNLVGTQYMTAMLDVELLRIAITNHVANQKQLKQIQEQVDIGARPPVDAYNQLAKTKAAELVVIQAEINLGNDKATLAQTLLLDPFDEFDVERPSWDVNSIGAEKVDVLALAERAKASRGDYQRAVKLEKSLHFAVAAARGNLFPNIYGFYNYSSNYNFVHGIPKTRLDSVGNPEPNPNYPLSFSEQFKRINPRSNYGVQLSIPIFNAFQNKNTVVQQKVLYQNAIVTRSNVEMQIRNDVVKAVRNFEGAKKVYAITAEKQVYAEKAMELEQQRYELGVTSFVEFSNANNVLVQAQTDRAQAEYKLIFQKILLGYAAGTLSAEDVSSPDQNR